MELIELNYKIPPIKLFWDFEKNKHLTSREKYSSIWNLIRNKVLDAKKVKILVGQDIIDVFSKSIEVSGNKYADIVIWNSDKETYSKWKIIKNEKVEKGFIEIST